MDEPGIQPQQDHAQAIRPDMVINPQPVSERQQRRPQGRCRTGRRLARHKGQLPGRGQIAGIGLVDPGVVERKTYIPARPAGT
jgi:hypothetical protein